jgi:GNAT superfamily N-acetyltransferase
MKDAAANGPRNKDGLANYSFSESLRDGRSVVIRAIRPDDRGLFHDALGKISPQSLYFRLFSGKRSFSDEELKPFLSVDFINTVALLAVLNKEGAEEIVGGGRYIRMDTPGPGQSAEVAFLVEDAYQGLGIGSRIFKHLAAIARASGVTHFEAGVLPSNMNMLRLFARSGLPITKAVTRDSVHLTIQLNPGQGSSPAAGAG